MSTSNGTHYFEDFAPGQVFGLGTYPPVTEADIIDFARQWDPQYFHVDSEAAKESQFGGLIASGWHTGAILMHLFVNNFPSLAASQGSPGLEQVRFLRPVRPGDKLTGRYTVLKTEPSESRPHLGKILSRMELSNQDGDDVIRVDGWGFFTRRPASSPA